METRIAVWFIVALMAAITYRLYSGSSIYEDHDLHVTRIVGQYSWMVRKADGTAARLDFCKNFDVSKLEPEPGYTIETLIAEDRGHCLNIIPGSKYTLIWKKGPDGWAEREQ